MTESLWFWWLKIIGKINYNLTKGIRMKSTSKSRIFQIVHNNSFKKQLLRPFSLQFQHRIYLSRHLNKVDIKVRLTIRTYSYAFHRCAVYFAIEWNCSQAPARIPTLERKFIKRRMSSMIPLDEHPVQVSDHNLTRPYTRAATQCPSRLQTSTNTHVLVISIANRTCTAIFTGIMLFGGMNVPLRIYITQVFTWKCVGATAYIKEIRESGGGDELGKGWKGTMGVGSKTKGENVPREIIDCIRWVSIPGADCAANLSASPRLTRASMGGLPRLCTLYSSTTRPMANVCSKSRISRPVPPPSANWLAGYIIIIVAFNATAFNEQPWCNAIRYRVTKNYRSNNFFRSD